MPRRRHRRRPRARWSLLLVLVLSILSRGSSAAARESERLYLSGTGFGDAREWEFRIDRGRGSGRWTTIPVPSQWELEGFGGYAYGRHDEPAAEIGSYRYRFETPATWRGRRVQLVFEGAMTDTVARLNGEPAGPVHHGGFTRFGYDVSGLLRYGGPNLLEVTVAEESSDPSVNAAERQADYWVFGGIYRPVYLEASPAGAIAYAAIDARHDGSLRVAVELDRAPSGARLVGQVRTLDGEPVGRPLTADAAVTGGPPGSAVLEARLPGISAWSAERPRLYRLELALELSGERLHETGLRFGFRTIELRPGEGLFVNGRRALLKGINRHSFWPESGRALNRDLNYRDAELIKELNANAVRASHYPPDVEFLDACDELGLYVIDELPGWHDAYRAAVGRGLVREMVRRDVNHPSVILWANGNEGGWNPALDGEFHRHDPQRRTVIHPGAGFSGIDARHYPEHGELASRLDDGALRNRVAAWRGRLPLVLPTEMLHGLYDGGLGAGLEGFWELIRGSRRGAGGFLWAFLDEGVVRTDRDGEIDTHGAYAPDGLVGPFRDREASFDTVRRVWSPVAPVGPARPGPGGIVLAVENRFSETDLSECRFRWRGLRLPGPAERGGIGVLFERERAGPALAPGERGRLVLPVPGEAGAVDAVELTAIGPTGRELLTEVLPVTGRARLAGRWLPAAGPAEPAGAGRSAPEPPVLAGHGVEARFDARSGELVELRRGGLALPLAGGPRRAADLRRAGVSAARAVGTAALSFAYDRGLRSARWSLHSGGWLRLEYEYESTRVRPYEGIAFDYPLPDGAEIEWLGRGPSPVWRNRLAGPVLGRWRRALTPAGSRSWRYDRGFYAGVRWLRIAADRAGLTVVPESPGLYVGVSAPSFPPDARNARAELPARETLSFLHAIPAIGSKFHPAAELASRPEHVAGRRRGVVWFLAGGDPPGSQPAFRGGPR